MKTLLHLRRGVCAQPALFFGLTAIVLLLLGGVVLRAHEHQHTHASLTVGALRFLDQTFPEDGAQFSSSARINMRNGCIIEDDYYHFYDHFYNPKTGLNTHKP